MPNKFAFWEKPCQCCRFAAKVAEAVGKESSIRKPTHCCDWLTTAGFLALAAPLALAQETTPTPSDSVEMERIIVTGSHIPTAAEVGPNPVLNINRELINLSGARTTEELIRNLTIAGPNGAPTSNNGAGLTPGASSISLRGFDASSTLTLIDGRRVAPYPLGTGNGAVTFVDLNSIPRAAIESIEILKDGASSTYGADAVAGVVNIKLRHDYRGAEAMVEYGNTLDKDSSGFAASLVFGAGDGTTSVSGVLNFYHRNSIFNRDRGYSNRPSSLSTNSSPLNLQLSREPVVAAGVPPDALPGGDLFFGHAPFFTGGNAPPTDYVYTPFRSSRFNFNAFSTSLPDSERYGGYVNFTHQTFGEQLVLFGDLLYQNVETRYQLAPAATGNFQTPGNVTLAIPPRAPGPTSGGPTYEETGVPFGAFNPFNPFQQIISGGTRARLAEFGNRLRDNTTDAFLSTLGAKGEKLFDGSWGYDAGFRYSKVKNISDDTGVSASRFNRILNAADPIFDPASPEFIGATVPYNPFGDYRVPIPSNFIPTAFATVHPKSTDQSSLATLDLNIYSTSLFKLPAGGVGVAFGGQFRRETLQQGPDESMISGDVIGAGFGNFTDAGRKTYAFYGEANLPVFSPVFSAPGFYSLEFTAAGRFEAFRNNDTNVLVPKFGMRWQPFGDSFTVRATWGEGFQQPSLIELFGSPVEGLDIDGVTDPVTETSVPEVPFIIRSNPNLQPADSRSFSGGFVYTPRFFPGLTLTVDFYNIESTGQVVIPDIQNVVDRSVTGQLLPLEAVNRDANGEIVSIEEAFQNAGSQRARGVDLGLQYVLGTRFGTFTWLTQASYLDSFQFAQLPGETERELRSGVLPLAFSDEAYLKWRANSRLDWAWQGYDLVIIAHYLDGFHERFVSGREHYVKQTWFFDVQASYNFTFVPPVEIHPVAGYGKDARETKVARDGESEIPQTTDVGFPVWKRLLHNTTLTVGCNNVFGHDPPFSSSTVGYPGFLYDSTGRFVYFSLTKRF